MKTTIRRATHGDEHAQPGLSPVMNIPIVGPLRQPEDEPFIWTAQDQPTPVSLGQSRVTLQRTHRLDARSRYSRQMR